MCFKSYRNQILCFQEYFSEFLWPKRRKYWSSCHKNYYIVYAFANSKIESLGLIYCEHCARRFQKSRFSEIFGSGAKGTPWISLSTLLPGLMKYEYIKYLKSV